MEGFCYLFITPSGVRTFLVSGGHCNNARDTQEHIKTVEKQVWFYFISANLQSQETWELSPIFR